MPAYFSEYMAEQVLNNQLVDGPALVKNGTLYCALFHDSTGTTEENLRNNIIINEITDTNYLRQAVTITGGGAFSSAAPDTVGSYVNNLVKITFPIAASDYPNAVVYVALIDSATSGNVILFASISAASPTTDRNIVIPLSSFKVSL